MLAADERHWWYRGRRRIVRAQIELLELPSGARILDAGCGSGHMLDEFARFGHATGVDIDPGSVERARERGRDAVLGSLLELPFADASFELVVCLDVLEHLPDDRAALRELLRVTAPGGALLVTVPAYQALWSAHDEANLHYRRYRAPALLEAAADAGWRPERYTYFNSVLLAPAAAVRLAQRRRGSRRPSERSELNMTPAVLDPVLELPLRLEAGLIGHGGRLPAGLSLLAVARRDGRDGGVRDGGGAPR
jgi:SAM-dependent methyltransferase